MSIQNFQSFISHDDQLSSFSSCLRTVDLLNLHESGANARRYNRNHLSHFSQPRVALVVDAENGLDRLYGGFFSDWSCGGQWAHMLDYLANLIGTLNRANVQLAFFFNGALEPERFQDWRKEQLRVKENVIQVLRHINKRATPPPKAWWVAPCGIQTMLRLALKVLNSTVISSVDSHRQEVMSFCWENGYHGILADDSEYALANAPRYFSLKNLKMTFQFEISSVEYVMDEVAKSMDMNPNRFCLLATLLGNHILPPKDLEEFHLKIAPELKEPKYKVGFERVIRAVVNYIRTLPKIDDYERISSDVFGSATDHRIKKFKSSLQYFYSLTQEGHKKPKPKTIGKKMKKINSIRIDLEGAKKSDRQPKRVQSEESKKIQADLVERIALDLDKMDLNEAISVAAQALQDDKPSSSKDSHVEDDEDNDELEEDHDEVNEDKKKDEMSVLQALASGIAVEPSAEGKYPEKKDKGEDPVSSLKSINIPDMHPDIYKTALDRHRQAQMSPLVFQLLTRGEIKLPVLLEDVSCADTMLPIHLVYRPLRQSVYAVLFNLNHQKFNRRQAEETIRGLRRKADELTKLAKKKTDVVEKEALIIKADELIKEANNTKIPNEIEIRVREWIPYNDYKLPDIVEAHELGWSVPTVQRVWFGSNVEDKQKRLRAFLSCMKCDDCPPLLIQSNVPQHMLLLGCVLRYLLTNQQAPVLRKPELDALIATAFSPELGNPSYLAEMKLDMVTKRGVQLATLINQGFEMAIFANDACGAPIPFQMCLPWTFFDGKLFHSKMRKADNARNLMELCDGRMEFVYAVERMRAAILHGLLPHYANPNHMATFGHSATNAIGRGQVVARGGRLVVGGAIVGQWGTNYGSLSGHQHVMHKKKKKKSAGRQKTSAGRGITVASDTGTSVLASEILTRPGQGDADAPEAKEEPEEPKEELDPSTFTASDENQDADEES